MKMNKTDENSMLRNNEDENMTEVDLNSDEYKRRLRNRFASDGGDILLNDKPLILENNNNSNSGELKTAVLKNNNDKQSLINEKDEISSFDENPSLVDKNKQKKSLVNENDEMSSVNENDKTYYADKNPSLDDENDNKSLPDEIELNELEESLKSLEVFLTKFKKEIIESLKKISDLTENINEYELNELERNFFHNKVVDNIDFEDRSDMETHYDSEEKSGDKNSTTFHDKIGCSDNIQDKKHNDDYNLKNDKDDFYDEFENSVLNNVENDDEKH
ncbi:hypothetical protein DMUE_3592 [Dictyocoela muelleri]|nr:hypothetical protein DMUE_3592 [Dictyocoela muelleri]